MKTKYDGFNKYSTNQDSFKSEWQKLKKTLKVAGVMTLVGGTLVLGESIFNPNSYFRKAITSPKIAYISNQALEKKVEFEEFETEQENSENIESRQQLNYDYVYEKQISEDRFKEDNKNNLIQRINNESENITEEVSRVDNDYISRSNYEKDYTYKLAQVIYGEAANQPEKTRRMVAKVALNRAGRKGYPSTLDKVLSQNNAFSCTGADVNKTWKQAIGKLPMNDYEKKVFNKCIQDAKYVLEGKDIGVKNEDEIVAYHDARVYYSKLRDSKKHGSYWKKLNHVGRYGNLEFYTEKK